MARRKGSRNAVKDPGVVKFASLVVERMAVGQTFTVKELAAEAGIARETGSRFLNSAEGRQAVNAAVSAVLGGPALARAMAKLNALLDSKSDYVAYEAAERVLAIAGHKPPSAAPMMTSFSGPVFIQRFSMEPPAGAKLTVDKLTGERRVNNGNGVVEVYPPPGKARQISIRQPAGNAAVVLDGLGVAQPAVPAAPADLDEEEP